MERSYTGYDSHNITQVPPYHGLRTAGVACMSLHVSSSVTMSTSDMSLGGTRGTGGVLRLRATSSCPGEGVKGNPVLAYN
jgi:hypothetical protein